jgi:P pilus assembly chaperone PapD
MRGRALLMAAAGLVGLAALSLSAAAAPLSGQNGTTLISNITATTERTRTYEWTLTKTASAQKLEMFRNDSATVTYTVTASKGAGVEKAFLKGTITVTNGGEVATQDLQIVVQSSLTPNNAPVLKSATVDLGAKSQLQPGETAAYAYVVEVPGAVSGESYKATALITIKNHSGSIGSAEGPSPAATAVMTAAIADVNASVNVDDSFGPTFAFSASGTQTYTRTFRCDEDRGDKVNTATIRQTGQSASATVTVNCYSLSVTTGATTSFTRTWTWSIAKGASTSAVTLEPDNVETRQVDYEVTLSSTSADSAWAVKGDIVISNPAPIAAPLSSVTAVLPAGPATVTCPASAAATDLTTCTYERSLPSGAATSVTATVTMPNAPSGTTSYTASANVDFASAAITKVDESVTVTDVLNGNASTTLGTATGSARYTYPRIVGPYSKCGPYTFANTASFLGASGARGSASANVAVTVKCYDLTLEGTATTSLTRTWTWSIDKTASADSLTLEPGQAGSVGYVVALSAQSADSQWAASGRLTVTNPAPVAASLSSLTATAAGTGAALSGCPVSVPARGSVDCAWSASLGSAAGGPLALSASLANSDAFNSSSYSGSGTVDFSGATVTKVDETATVTDTFGGGTPRDLGFVTAPSGRFDYSQTIAATNKCGTTTVSNVAAFRTPSGRTGNDGTSTTVDVKCYQLRAGATADTSFTRTWQWTLTKTADRESLTLASGTTGTIGYSITLTPSSSDGGWNARGTVTVTNPAPVATSLSGIAATIGATPVTVTCPSLDLAAGASVECAWSTSLPSGSLTTFSATATLADAAAFSSPTASAGAIVAFGQPDQVDETATVRDVMGGTERTFGPATAGAPTTYTYSMPVGPFSGCAPTSVTNSATLTTGDTGTTRNAAVTTPVTLTCPQLGVRVDAGASLTRSYTWTIAKAASTSAITLATGATQTVGYTVTLGRSSVDSAWRAGGTITITNPSSSAVTLSSVTANDVTVTCPTLTVAAGGSLACSWTRTLGAATDGSVTATATLAAGQAFAGSTYDASASYAFASATVNAIDGSVTVSDTADGKTRSLGTVSASQNGVLPYDLTVGPYKTCGQYTFANTATFTTSTTQKKGSASANVGVTVTCTSTPPPTATTNCTLTIGYWKTHGSETAKYLPQTLGNELVTQAAVAVNILKKEDSSVGTEKLKAQLLAAKLSIKRGADPSAVSSTIIQADEQLRRYATTKWTLIPKSIQSAILATASTLDKYNNGIIGPGHCP